MPPMWAGRRRGLFILLVTLGIFQAVLALIMALSVDALLSPGIATDKWDSVALVGTALGIGIARWIERVVAEDLGQDYVFEQRHRLIISSVGGADYSGSLGVTVTRASNDLSAVRNWIALGIVPLVTGIPLIAVVLIGLLFISPQIGLAVAIPIALIGAAIPILAHMTYVRSRALRRRRGRLSSRIADTVMASESVRASGAVAREVKAIDRHSDRVVDAAVDRAWVTGLTRSLTATAASLCTVAVVLIAVEGWADSSVVASAMTLLGVLAAPVTDLGRVVEYRQNYKAATRILGPVLEKADELSGRESQRQRKWELRYGNELLSYPDLPYGQVQLGKDFVVDAGDIVLMSANDRSKIRDTLAAILSVNQADKLVIAGYDFGLAPEKVRRNLVGFASDYVPVERGSIQRLLTLRQPDASPEKVASVLETVGLTETVESHPKGMKLQLKSGGAPWSIGETTRLKIARAALNTPPLLVLEDVDHQLDGQALTEFFQFIADYPGVVLISTAKLDLLPSDHVVWNVDDEQLEESGQDEVLAGDEEE
ncbi:ABC transporter ATP-binding protein [Corynebacterium breve]|uniref:ABC transporter ATP-binding protein n=1 Tax=Corynebacterium breve TaxID=3049799 RepID=A0ABY8VH94_9CORY|nr:ABC transporter ATP-binding protein [Corynebacterium breve]WIM69015.1 ABC transporter ATP-binding protein [Corynebacterium breve]